MHSVKYLGVDIVPISYNLCCGLYYKYRYQKL